MGFMNTMISFMGDNLLGYAAVIGPILWDIVRRVWPTKKPASLGHDFVAILKKVMQVAEKLVEVLDVFLPQKVKKIGKK